MQSFGQKLTHAREPAFSSISGPRMATPAPDHREHPILHLQRVLGNQAVQRMLQRDAEELRAASAGTISPRLAHDSSRISAHPPTAGAAEEKSAINQPGGEYAEE